MRVDAYTKAVLTVIAIALVVLVLRDVPLVSTARAQATATRCTGDITANAWGGTKELVGGYSVDVRCR